MGTLLAKHYRTFAGLADHTYVECSSGGKGWNCWGRKEGGALLRQGSGSTRRADAIAGVKERAGITCSLINGVCHQAANRILLPAGITVRGAKGSGLSTALFGTYGRPRGIVGRCQAPFDQHPDVGGDLPECMAAGPGPASASEGHDDSPEYLDRVLKVYRSAEELFLLAGGFDASQVREFQSTLFALQVEDRLHLDNSDRQAQALHEILRSAEIARREFEEPFESEDLGLLDFAKAFEDWNEQFQNSVANALDAKQYQELLDSEPGDIVKLADPEAVGGATTAE